ncbi:ECF transporter S component [Apilactobacillus ozensis]|uniref:Riboflavin transporter n=2 Tax=Apilactobacillus ozensis TaxID=866801 RepID=A0A0R2AYB8_9LACO|nr:ECF transporter S component [Apilactobacillus ozensis]KRM67868.1 substrate-specific component ribu of riboflavin ecf transporter [Apilactobacillus ozensis DSM 23829 = JCM 17196]MCK8606482.1 ECF transporter S component [Apilactobacillus ozensis]
MGSKRFSVKKMVTISILSGLSFFLMYIKFPIIPIASYMTIDFSDIPILIGALTLSKRDGAIIALLKSLLYFVFTGPSIINLIGVGSAFISSLVILFSLVLIIEKFSGLKRTLLGILVTILNLTVIMSLLNYFIITPLYIDVIGFKFAYSIQDLVLYAVVPFNIIKGLIVTLTLLIIYKRIVKTNKR